MANLNVITDASGKLLGAVSAESYKTSDGKELQFRAHPRHKHQVIQVDDRLMRGSAKELGDFLRSKLV